MIEEYLDLSIGDLISLVDITQKDIKNIKEANHEEIFASIKIKEDLIVSFEQKKRLLDNELSKISKSNPEKDFNELLSPSVSSKLDVFKEKLKELKELNKKYAKFVLTISEFYNSLLDQIVPQELDGYNKKVTNSSILKIDV
jgi:hypothetical protein